LKHPTGVLKVGIAVSLSLAIISASSCANRKQSTQSPATGASPQPAASSNTTAGAARSSSFQRWKNSQIIEAFKAAGLEVENPRQMTKPQDYGKIPAIDVECTQFAISLPEIDAAGHIFSFASEDQIEKMVQYYADASADNFSWVYVKDNILVQLDGRLEEEKAKQYEAAMGNVK
jgi:hypothetical protein